MEETDKLLQMKVIFLMVLSLSSLTGCSNDSCQSPDLPVEHYLTGKFANELSEHCRGIFSIGVSSRGYRHIRVFEKVESSKLLEKRFVSFYPNNVSSLELENRKLDTDKLKSWHDKFLWMYENGVLNISEYEWGYAIGITYSDSTFQELKEINPDYFDLSYNSLENEIERYCSDVELKYRYKLLLPRKMAGNNRRLINDYVTRFSSNRTIVRQDKVLYYRTLSNSEFCSISFSDEQCPND